MSVQQSIEFAKEKTQLKNVHIQHLKGVIFFLGVGERVSIAVASHHGSPDRRH